MTPDIQPDLSQVQGNILRGYRKPLVRHLVLRIGDPVAARRWLLDATSGDETLAPQITRAEWGDDRPTVCVNVGITHHGLRALGVPQASLDSFPHEFVDGMASRSRKLGDTGPSDPSTWKPEWQDPTSVHLMVTIHADADAERAETGDRPRCRIRSGLFRTGATRRCRVPRRDSSTSGTRTASPSRTFAASATRGSPGPPTARRDRRRLLGYKTPVENLRWEVPQPDVLGLDGSFNAFRVLEQRVEEFESFLTDSADVILANPLGTRSFRPGSRPRGTRRSPVTRRCANSMPPRSSDAGARASR